MPRKQRPATTPRRPAADLEPSAEPCDEPWAELRRFTAARIGLARSGASLATGPLLDLRLAHARARDAVHAPLDEARLLADLAGLGLPVLAVASAADDRQHYLMRPDLGRRLKGDAAAVLAAQVATQVATHVATHAGSAHDVAFVVSDGLSARAVQTHARPLLAEVLPRLRSETWSIAPLVVVRQGRVAIGDVIASALQACIVVMLIGERPGLSSPDSMGAYLTLLPAGRPAAETTDADRNCISNIRPEGLGYADAAFKLVHLLRAIRARGMSGVRLKDAGERLLIEER
jgi:ethanolamine ammonia-lyase small subunit